MQACTLWQNCFYVYFLSFVVAYNSRHSTIQVTITNKNIHGKDFNIKSGMCSKSTIDTKQRNNKNWKDSACRRLCINIKRFNWMQCFLSTYNIYTMYSMFRMTLLKVRQWWQKSLGNTHSEFATHCSQTQGCYFSAILVNSAKSEVPFQRNLRSFRKKKKIGGGGF